jgi:hypothetical protein
VIAGPVYEAASQMKWARALLLPIVVGGASVAFSQVKGDQYAQLVVREQVIVRVPARPQQTPRPVHWKEGKGPKCVAARAVAGATMLSQNSVDLVLRDRSRVRAKLENCPALDYYYGFYVTPSKDGMICADRDVIRSRMGGRCRIDRFRSLEASPRG